MIGPPPVRQRLRGDGGLRSVASAAATQRGGSEQVFATSGDARIVGLVVHSGRLITTSDGVITVGGAR